MADDSDKDKGAGPTRRAVIATAASVVGASVALPFLGRPAQALQFVTAIVELRNASNCYAVVKNWENTRDTENGKGDVAAGAETSVKMWIPWCGKSADLPKHRITVSLYRSKDKKDFVRSFTIWQSDIDGVDRVRVSTDGRWYNPGDVIGGVAAAGPRESLLYWIGDRSLIINDFSLWLLPIELVKALKNARGLLAAEGVRICDWRTRSLEPAPPGTKTKISAFSMAGPPSDAFSQGRANARFLYRDSGKRYEFTLSSGKVTVEPKVMTPSFNNPAKRVAALSEAVSYDKRRQGDLLPAVPEFDMIAANGGRVFAKEKGTDRFFFAIVDEMFIHSGAKDNAEYAVPSSYFKLDPEFNGGSENKQHVLDHLDLRLGGKEEKRPSHPATARWPLYRVALNFGATPAFSVTVKRGVWHLIDTRPPDRRLAPDGAPGLALVTQLLSLPPAALGLGFLVNILVVTHAIILLWQFSEAFKKQVDVALNNDPPAGAPKYDHIAFCSNPQPAPVWRPSIDFSRVIDIGVGHMHHHQQYDRAAGAEVRILTAELTPEYPDNMYQVFNGPIDDADGYNDGTCNFYLLVKLRNGAYALLYLDEQSFFSSRWRFADPDDYKGSYGANLTATLATKPELHRGWSRTNYWSPFQSGLIGDQSRMAVSGQVVLLTGNFRFDMETIPLIYSTNFSFGTMDRTWRWRKLPPNVGFREGDPALPPDTNSIVYPQSIRLRDDLTIHLKGSLTDVGPGRWWQRYLPTSNELVPPNATGQRPDTGFSHAWKFMSERAFQLADRFSHFGVYDQVDTRTRYYPVQTPTAQVAQALTAVAATTAVDPDRWWSADASQLWVDAYTFRIDTLESPWPPTPPYAKRPMNPSSLFNPKMYLKIVKRGSRWIAMVRDKRDDDLVGFSALPKSVTLKTANPARTISVQLFPAVPMPEGPGVEFANFWWDTPDSAAVAFKPHTGHRIGENIWRVRMATFDASGAVVQLLDVIAEGTFAFNPATNTHDYRWTPTASAKQQLLTYATERGSFVHGTSIWFEDVTGHVATPDRIHWVKPTAGTRTIQLAVTGTDAQVWLQAIGPDGRPVGGYVLGAPGQIKAAEPGPYIGSAGVRQIFVIGTDDRISFLKVDAAGKSAGGYIPLSTGTAKALSVGYYPDPRWQYPQFSPNRLPLLFTIGADDQVYFHKFDQALNPVGGFVRLPGSVGMKTILARGVPPALVTVGIDDLVYLHNFDQNGNPVGSYVQVPNPVKAVSSTKGVSDLYVIGADDQVYRRQLNNDGLPLGPDILDQPMKVKALQVGRPNLYVIGMDDQVSYRNFFSANAFTAIPGKVKAIHLGNDDVTQTELLFVIGTDDQVYVQRFDRSGQNILIGGYPHYIPIPGPVIAIDGLSPAES